MNLSTPLASLFSGLDAVALRVVAGAGTEMTGRQIARVASTGSADNIRRALLRLAQIGLVLVDVAPHASMYSANREHILWPAIEVALNARHELVSRISSFTAAAGISGVTVSLYGSVARGESTQDSDVDLVVVFPDSTPSAARDDFVSELQNRVHRWTGNTTQIYDLDREDLIRQHVVGDPIILRWLTDEVSIAGLPIRDLVGGT